MCVLYLYNLNNVVRGGHFNSSNIVRIFASIVQFNRKAKQQFKLRAHPSPIGTKIKCNRTIYLLRVDHSLALCRYWIILNCCSLLVFNHEVLSFCSTKITIPIVIIMRNWNENRIQTAQVILATWLDDLVVLLYFQLTLFGFDSYQCYCCCCFVFSTKATSQLNSSNDICVHLKWIFVAFVMRLSFYRHWLLQLKS